MHHPFSSAGAFFMTDLIVTFHVGFIATYNLRKVLVMNGRLIARFYVRHVSGCGEMDRGRARHESGLRTVPMRGHMNRRDSVQLKEKK